MVRRIGSGEKQCPICGVEEENLFDLFKECQGARMIAFASVWGFRLENWEVSNISDIISCCINPGERPAVGRERRWQTIFFSSLLYCCWLYRNKVVHEGAVDSAFIIIMCNRMVEEQLKEDNSAGSGEFLDQRLAERKEDWTLHQWIGSKLIQMQLVRMTLQPLPWW